ncbi:carbohydrate ABC transporter permease [Halorussus amylolyticus]|uniref:carbohydrate ABC transporter permease n=1 Tax=Halorussus amylolyticus TaxID=1126242 RepID=UPI00104AF3A2|nr:sugar ABC transporter permease [Halorussus amylolyticus]
MSTIQRKEIFESKWQAALLVLPTLTVLAVFLYYPFVQTIDLALQETQLLGNAEYVGLSNFEQLLTSDRYRNSLWVTTWFAVLTVSGSLLVSTYLAFLIHETVRGSSWYLIAAIWPYALPMAVAGSILNFIFHPELGIFTNVLEVLFGVSLNWHVDGTQAFLLVSAATIWKGIGYNVIFLVAALGLVPESLDEAAKLDGIGRTQRLVRIYLPLISPTLVFLLIINSIRSFFGGFSLVDIMTGGGPNEATNLLIFNLYQDSFTYNQFGLGSAQSIVLFLVVSVLMYVQLKKVEKFAYYG